MDMLLFEKPTSYTGNTFISTILSFVNRMAGDTQTLNNALWANFVETCQYYDDFFDKTALFLDSISLAEV